LIYFIYIVWLHKIYGCDFFCILFYVAVVGDDEEKDGGSGRFQFQPMPTTSTEALYVYNIDDDDE
jgi:hypothetical protein